MPLDTEQCAMSAICTRKMHDSSTIRKPTEFIITGEMLKNLNLLNFLLIHLKNLVRNIRVIYDGD